MHVDVLAWTEDALYIGCYSPELRASIITRNHFRKLIGFKKRKKLRYNLKLSGCSSVG